MRPWSPLSRRTWLRSACGAPLALRAQETGPRPLSFPGKQPMLVHSDFPEDLESPAEYFTTWLTPADRFFVRQHLPRPKIDAGSHKIEISGGSKSVLSVEDLRKLPAIRIPATLECAGNGRGNFRPRVPGLQWTKGAIGNAEWRGPRLKDVLARAGAAMQGAAWVNFDGADTGVGKTPDFIRSVPMRKVLHEATILALEMNGQPLPEIHGGPVRLIVPGWDGATWVKWVSAIELSERSHAGFYMATAYKYPKNPLAPGAAVPPEDMEVLEGMAVKSFFARPADQSRHKLGPVELVGAAWGGENRLTRVDVSADGGSTWRPAELSPQNYPSSWRIWNYEWRPERPGYHVLCARATDSAGRTQPIEAQWNPSGYLYNAIERVGVVVEG